jgi:mono/diheme cytochrome c family protein
MHDQPRYEPLEASAFFKDGRSSRPQVEGTVARGQLRLDEHLYTGKIGGKPAVSFPFAITETVLERGRDRFNIFCSACHGKLGNGQGIVVQRGLKAPPSFHIDRLRQSPPGYYFDVMTNGFGAMFDLSHAVAVRDRWAIAAYVRVLQRSQRATLEDVPEPQRAALVEERERMKEGSK